MPARKVRDRPCIASSATFALNSAVKRLRVFMMVRPSHRRIHLNRLSQEPGPAQNPQLRAPSLDATVRLGVHLSPGRHSAIC